MPNYSVEGKLGTGKGKFCVYRLQEAARDGRKIAGNMDIVVNELTPERVTRYVRIPDKPTVHDLEALGHGNPDSYDEEKNGVLVLDELGTWLNARGFQDKERAGVLDWLIHARKHGWDVYMQVQSSEMVDKQIRVGLIEFACVCRRMDKIRIPLIGGVLSLIHPRLGRLPRWHRVTSRMVLDAGQHIVAERWNFRGTDLHAAYDTRQVFRADYPHGPHTVLPPWDWKPRRSLLARLREVFDRHRAEGRQAADARSAARRVDKPRVVQLLMGLPPDDRIRHTRRLVALGLI